MVYELRNRSSSQLGNADGLEASIASATQGLLGYRQADGHWVFELEADCTIPAEYVLLGHYLGEPADTVLEAKIANYLRRVQGAHGGWPLVHDGEFDMSASVKAYFALKMIGDSIDAPHMVRAREAIHARGGAVKSNVFTRFMGVASLQSSTCSRPCPVMWVSPFLACATGAAATGTATVMTQVASDPATAVQCIAGPLATGEAARLSLE